MLLPFKKRYLSKNQPHESNGRFKKSKKFKENIEVEENFEFEKDFEVEEDLVIGEWGDEKDSGWKDDNLKNEVWINKGILQSDR